MTALTTSATAENIKYENLARDMGVELGGWSFGMQFGDLNNDGNLDLYVTNGYVSADRGTSYWYDYSKIAGGNSRIISDAANWPPMGNRSLSGYQPKRLWINDGAGHFTDVAQGITDEAAHARMRQHKVRQGRLRPSPHLIGTRVDRSTEDESRRDVAMVVRQRVIVALVALGQVDPPDSRVERRLHRP